MRFRTILSLIAVLCLALRLQAEEPLRVAAAISLRDVLAAIASDFEKDGGTKIEFTFGSSGQLLAQIQNGAPIDVFISAAHDQVDVLEREGLSAPGARRIVAANQLVLIVPKKTDVMITKFEDLSRADVKRVAIGEPTTVPAGQYAQQVLEKLRLTEQLKDRLVYGMNVRQVLDYVVRGEVTAGIVYASDAKAEPSAVKIVATADESWHKPIEYPAVVIKATRQAAAPEKYCAWLVGEKSAAIFGKFGFSLPSKTAARPSAERDRTQTTTQPGRSRDGTLLKVGGVGLNATDFDAPRFSSLPRTSVSVKERDGASTTFEGVRVADILTAAGMKFGHNLRGPRLADYLIAEAGDGYRVVYTLTEFDAEFSDRVVLLADRCDGKPLPDRDGPLRIVVSDERKHARWVRNTTRLTIESAPKSSR